MLRKLMKHEWRNSSKIGAILLLAITGVTLIVALSLYLSIQGMTGPQADENGWFAALSGMTLFTTLMLAILVTIAASWGMILYQGIRFYKTMYSEEGYLTHTLPVTPGQLLASKTLVAGLWYLFMAIAIALSVCAMFLSIFLALGGEVEWNSFWRDISRMFRMFFQDDPEAMSVLIHLIVSGVLMMIVTPFSGIMLIFGSLTIGQLARKYRALVGILVYIGMIFANSIICTILRMVFSLLAAVLSDYSGLSIFFYIFSTYDLALVVNAGMAVALYFISRHILTNRLNLE